MTAGRITLEAWIAATYAPAGAPKLNTVRAWAKKGKLEPPAVKEGRAYYVEPYTRYTDGPPRGSLVERIRAAYAQSEEQRPAA